MASKASSKHGEKVAPFEKSKLLALFGNTLSERKLPLVNSPKLNLKAEINKHGATTAMPKTKSASKTKSHRPLTKISQPETKTHHGKRNKNRLQKPEHEPPAKKLKPSETIVPQKSTTKTVNSGKGNKPDRMADKVAAMKTKLDAARFRYINEMLYTSHSKEAIKSFKEDPESFEVYHRGYRNQIEKWPVKPIDLAIKYVKARNRKDTIADLGCGEAKLARSVKHRVLSFDLRAINPRVKVADISKLPLKAHSVSHAIFCLSLMGTNITEFIKEAHRVLKPQGTMWIAEVASRFNGDLKTFCEGVESVGFQTTKCDTDTSTHFVIMVFRRKDDPSPPQPGQVTKKVKKPAPIAEITLAPCLYKKR